MEVYLFHPDLNERYYNCNAYKVEDIPLEKRKHEWLGLGFMCFAAIYEVLYMPCMFSIWKQMSHHNHCYRIMFYIGIVDMLALVAYGLFTGYFGYIGAVFCSHPRLNYIVGMFVYVFWCSESMVEVMLALNRCFELWSPELATKIFGGKKVLLWLLVPSIYGIILLFWAKPVFFSGIYMSWFFNPHIGYLEDTGHVYENMHDTIHNIVIFCSIIILYSTFSIIFFIQSKDSRGVNNQQSFSQKMIFFQVFLISMVNVLAISMFVYMQYVQFNEALVMITNFCWLNVHGLPPVIYLTMNKSIRSDCLTMLLKLIGGHGHRPISVVNVHPATIEHS